MKQISFIYCLIDPRSSEPRYIGKSTCPRARLSAHMRDRSGCHRVHWLNELRRYGQKPSLLVLEQVEEGESWQEAERFWIEYGKSLGWSLTNNTSGGDGVPDLPSETRERVARAWLGRRHRAESLPKIGAAMRGKKHSEKTRAHMSAIRRGRPITWGEKIAETNRKLTRDQCALVFARLQNGEKVCDLAREFGMHRTSISKIKKGEYFGKSH